MCSVYRDERWLSGSITRRQRIFRVPSRDERQVGGSCELSHRVSGDEDGRQDRYGMTDLILIIQSIVWDSVWRVQRFQQRNGRLVEQRRECQTRHEVTARSCVTMCGAETAINRRQSAFGPDAS